jgi:hypothetical protein
MDWLVSDHVGTAVNASAIKEDMFSLMWGPCRVYISEPNAETRSGRSTEECREWD